MYRSIPILLLTLGLGACASQRSEPSASVAALVAQQTEDVKREIADAGQYYGVLEPMVAGKVTLTNPEYIVDDDLLRVVQSAFTGKIEDLVSVIARETGYRVVADGEKPGAPIVVVLVQQDLPALGALREGFGQAKGRARLIVNQSAKTMTIHYLRHENSPVPHIEDREV